MRIHNEIRAPAVLLRERHVLLGNDQTNHAFLAVPGTELVADFRSSGLPRDQLEVQWLLGGGSHDDSVNIRRIQALVAQRLRFHLHALELVGIEHAILGSALDISTRYALVHVHVPIVQFLSNSSHSILRQSMVLLVHIRHVWLIFGCDGFLANAVVSAIGVGL